MHGTLILKDNVSKKGLNVCLVSSLRVVSPFMHEF